MLDISTGGSPHNATNEPQPKGKLLTTKEVLAKLNIAQTTLYNYETNPDIDFPKSYRIGMKKKGWYEKDLDDWLSGRQGMAQQTKPKEFTDDVNAPDDTHPPKNEKEPSDSLKTEE